MSIARKYGKQLRVVEAAREVNCGQREKVIEKLLTELKIVKGRVIGILGVAFKPNTDDLRDAPALDIARRLAERGAKVVLHDPVALECARAGNSISGLIFKDSGEEVFTNADAVVLVTDWHHYTRLPFANLAAKMNTPIFLDGRNLFDPQQMAGFGFRYIGIGR
jgi:UDPglucose 6-dehydrogenase